MRLVTALGALLLCAAGFVGPAQAAVDGEASKACIKCHDAEDLPDMSRSAHAAVRDARAPGCVACHGLSPTHVNKPAGVKDRPRPDVVYGKGTAVPVHERNATCMGCHGKDTRRALWGGSQHDAADVPCTACHKVHTNHDKVQARGTQTDVCLACHKEQRAQIARPSRHPVAEGKMACSDCHNVHGSAGPRLVRRDSTNDTCYTCHAEKRGPFVHPHEPATQDCASCHNPHGSTIAAMLKARAPLLCQQCHTPHVAGGIGALGGQRGVFAPAAPGQVAPAVTATTSGKNVVNLWQGRSCLNCHTQVHGSNHPSATNPSPHFLTR